MANDSIASDRGAVPPVDDQLTEMIRTMMPLGDRLDICVRRMTAESVVMSLEWAPDLCTVGDNFHGGVMMALADSAGGAAAFSNLPPDATGTSTIESKTNFLAAASKGSLVAVSTPLHVGGTTIVAETEVYHLGADADTPPRLVAKTTQTQTVLRPRASS